LARVMIPAFGSGAGARAALGAAAQGPRLGKVVPNKVPVEREEAFDEDDLNDSSSDSFQSANLTSGGASPRLAGKVASNCEDPAPGQRSEPLPRLKSVQSPLLPRHGLNSKVAPMRSSKLARLNKEDAPKDDEQDPMRKFTAITRIETSAAEAVALLEELVVSVSDVSASPSPAKGFSNAAHSRAADTNPLSPIRELCSPTSPFSSASSSGALQSNVCQTVASALVHVLARLQSTPYTLSLASAPSSPRPDVVSGHRSGHPAADPAAVSAKTNDLGTDLGMSLQANDSACASEGGLQYAAAELAVEVPSERILHSPSEESGSEDVLVMLSKTLDVCIDVARRPDLAVAALKMEVFTQLTAVVEQCVAGDSKGGVIVPGAEAQEKLLRRALAAMVEFLEQRERPFPTGLSEKAILILSSQFASSVRAEAACILVQAARGEDTKEELLSHDAIGCCVDVLREAIPAPRLNEQVTNTLSNIAAWDGLDEAVAMRGAVPALVGLLATNDEQLVSAGLNLLANIIGTPWTRALLLRGGPTVMTLLDGHMRSGKEHFVKQVGWVVCSLATSEDVCDEFVGLGGLRLLVTYAASEDLQCQEEAAWALAHVSHSREHHLSMLETGSLSSLLRLVASPSPLPRFQALWGIANLSCSQTLKGPMGEAGAIPIVAEVLQPDCTDELTLQKASRTLANLAVDPRNHAQLIEAALPRFFALRATPCESVQVSIARTLVNIACEREQVVTLIDAGAGDLIAEMLVSGHPAVQEEAAWAVVNLSFLADYVHSSASDAAATSPSTEAKLADALTDKFLQPLVSMLSIDAPNTQEQLARALINFATSPATKLRIVEMGAFEVLRGLYKSQSDEVQHAAGMLLNSVGQVLTPMSRRAVQGLPEGSLKKPVKGSRLAKLSLSNTHHAKDPEAESAGQQECL